MYKINFKPRLYQEEIFYNAVLYNSLVVLPTGLGKTAIAIMLTIHRLNQHPNKKILFLAPTKPLAEQHYRSFIKETNIDLDHLSIFTGSTPPAKRKKMWPDAKVVFATPQGVENDVINNNINLEDVSLIVFDEAHRATGNYSYVWLAKFYNNKSPSPKILALTASPGHDLETIKTVIDNLFLDKIDVKKVDDPDVKPYVQDVKIEWLTVDLPLEYTDLNKKLKDLLTTRLKAIKYRGYLTSMKLTKSELLRLQASLQREIAEKGFDDDLLKSISLAAEAIKIEHMIELLETQGITPLRFYVKDLATKSLSTKNKSIINLAKDYDFKVISNIIEGMFEANDSHPKQKRLLQLLDEIYTNDKKLIIFSQYRDSANKLVESINDYFKDNVARIFVGQANRRQKGLSQKKQIEVLKQFKDNEFNILVSSSVGEEGLDIPKVDYVVFYEPIPSAIRTIQRRGRTGRSDEGKIYVLVAKATRDEAYKWVAIHKEKRMHNILTKLKQSELALQLNKKHETKLSSFITEYEDKPKTEIKQEVVHLPQKDKYKIIVDYREKNSLVLKNLIDDEFLIKLEQLHVGDYLLSKDVVVEYKTDVDFVNSIVDGRLFDQLKRLKQAFKKPIMIVEGNRDIYTVRNVHPNAIRGMLATIAISYNIPILFTINSKDSAMMMKTIATREQKDKNKEFSLHFDKPLKSTKQMQEYIVSSFPGIGTTLAKPLLTKFKSIKSIVNASQLELKDVEKIGMIKANNLFDLFNVKYSDE